MEKIIIASGPVIVEENKVLLNQHGDTEFWKFCGGRIRQGERLEEAARRRAKEEMGIEIEILNSEPYMSHATKDSTDGQSDVILVHFLAKRFGEIRPAEFIREWKWIPIKELPSENLAPNILPSLKHFGLV